MNQVQDITKHVRGKHPNLSRSGFRTGGRPIGLPKNWDVVQTPFATKSSGAHPAYIGEIHQNVMQFTHMLSTKDIE